MSTLLQCLPGWVIALLVGLIGPVIALAVGLLVGWLAACLDAR